ncbi:hypothetical protein AB6A40_006597 [Gnathostoma spinigerum]|uniref:GATA-type domain-containing protein n=1 Tax=Gnathostoma spinigerum TaxID=75299 RepID=A0ABD6ES93_9BILA
MPTETEDRTTFLGNMKAGTAGSNGDVDVVISAHDAINGLNQNGVHGSHGGCHDSGTPNWTTDSAENNAALSPSGDLSPSSLRRSTRACAIKAAEKIKLKESLASVDGISSLSGDGYISGEEQEVNEVPKTKKRRVATEYVLDQTDCKFGIKMEDEEVLLMSDESELSSLNDTELEQVKKFYDKVSHKELSEEQHKEREVMLKTLEADLRMEEAKLTMLKRLRLSQQVSVKQLQEANVRKMTANIAQNGSGNAYKPPVAAPHPRVNNSHAKVSSSSSSNSHNVSSRTAASTATAFMNLTPQQQQLLQNAAKTGLLNTAAAQALLQQAQQHVANGRAANQQAAALAAAAALTQQQHARSNSTQHSAPTQTPAQKAAAAKLALRRQLEQQLLQIPAPRPPPPEMLFIPNGNQPDFCYLLGLDLVVQRILKDKSTTLADKEKGEVQSIHSAGSPESSRVSEEPYQCEECGTDYTPSWRAIGTDESSLHLYCEACVKAAQKKKMRQDHTALLRKAFNKVLEKEQELDKQIAEGKFETPTPSSSTGRSSTPAATPPPTTVSRSSHHPPASSSATSAQYNSVRTPTSTSQSSGSHHHPKVNHKRAAAPPNMAATSTASTSAAQSAAAVAAAAIAAAAGGTSASLIQQQMAAAAALRVSNPMLAAMMANPLLNTPNMLQMQWNPLMQQRLPNLAMVALAQAVQSAQQTSGSSSPNVIASAASAMPATAAAAAAAAANPLAALAATMNPATAAAMFSSPQVLRQLQQAQQAMQRTMLLEYAKSQAKK